MDIKQLATNFTISDQVTVNDLPTLQSRGVKLLICNRPDGEGPGQPAWQELATAAEAAGMQMHYVPVVQDTINSADVRSFAALLQEGQPIHAFCRSGARTTVLWALALIAKGNAVADVVAAAKAQGVDLDALPMRYASVIAELTGVLNGLPVARNSPLLIIGGGAAGIALAASLLKRSPRLDITIVEPATEHFYQPGFTLVGAGVFKIPQIRRPTASLMPPQVKWIKAAVTHILPEQNQVVLSDNTKLSYERLAVCAGLKLNWGAVAGLEETLGKNGVTSNYRFDLAPYTWELVSGLKKGTALFTQPPMPIKCAGAPQKALYLSAHHWESQGLLKNIDIGFCNAGAVLFGVKEFVPALLEYIERYRVNLQLGHNLVRVDGPARLATFATTTSDGQAVLKEISFDMLHVCPPQCAPDFIRNSAVADRAGWVSVNQTTLQHTKYRNIWSIGDVCNAPNAKTAAAVRKQAPIAAENILADIKKQKAVYGYNGYGACPLTVERGKIVLAEFGYGGKLLPSLPLWLVQGTRPTRIAWWLKKTLMPILYWDYMLKGKEPLVKPDTKLD